MIRTRRRRRSSHATPAALALLFATAIASADAPTALDRRVDLDLVDAAAPQVFSSFAAVLDAELQLAPNLTGRVLTIRLDDVRVRTALDAACDSIGCSWELIAPSRGGAKAGLKVREAKLAAATRAIPELDKRLDEPISLDLVDASLEQVLATFANILGAELDLDPTLRGGKVTIRLTAVKLRDALDTVLGSASSWRLAGEVEPPRLLVRARAS